MRHFCSLVLAALLVTSTISVLAAPGAPEPVADREGEATSLSLRMRLLYANFSGAEVFLPEGPVGADENLSGDGVGGDVWWSSGIVDLGLTASSAFWLNRDPSYFAAVLVAKSLRAGDWRLSFGAGFGGVTLVDASERDHSERKTRPATVTTAHLDYFVFDALFVGLQVQSWVALGPEGDLGISSASLAVGYDLL